MAHHCATLDEVYKTTQSLSNKCTKHAVEGMKNVIEQQRYVPLALT